MATVCSLHCTNPSRLGVHHHSTAGTSAVSLLKKTTRFAKITLHSSGSRNNRLFCDMLQIVEWAWFQLSLPLNSGWYILYVETIWGYIYIYHCTYICTFIWCTYVYTTGTIWMVFVYILNIYLPSIVRSISLQSKDLLIVDRSSTYHPS